MDFPARKPEPCETPKELIEGLDLHPAEVLKTDDYFVVVRDESELRNLRPDFRILGMVDSRGIIVTAKGNEADFVSRFFAPRLGINEDPVTGSSHCVLTPYWSERLGKKELLAHQLSARGGELYCEDRGDRIIISGRAVKYMEGFIELPD